ncbi:MAG: efflux RND transporter periplasmic adaptor subunit, partial [Deltaproteobacteria bacterium]
PRTRTAKEANSLKDGGRIVWILRNGRPAPVQIKVGVTDGRMTEIMAGGITPGMSLLTDVVIQKSG